MPKQTEPSQDNPSSREGFSDFLVALTSAQNKYLLGMFVVYVVMLFSFAYFYYAFYRANHNNFVFNNDIVVAQHEAVKATTEREIEDYSKKLEVLRLLPSYLDTPSPKVQFGKWIGSSALKVYGDQYHYECAYVSEAVGDAMVSVPIFILRKTDGQELARLDMPANTVCPRQLEEARNVALLLIQKSEKQLADAQTRLGSLEGQRPEIWGYLDFLFSTITQTTVGYGDILPNSTRVRMVVVVQLVMGTCLLIVGINLVITKFKT